MKWIAISGSWRKTDAQVENDVRKTVSEILHRGDGIITGGAPGVDYFATDEALKHDPSAEKIRIYLPTSLAFYVKHTWMRRAEGVVDKDVGENVIQQLVAISNFNKSAIIEGEDIPGNKYVEKWQYYKRNGLIVAAADELIAFRVNESAGTGDAIEKAKVKGIPVKIFSYKID